MSSLFNSLFTCKWSSVMAFSWAMYRGPSWHFSCYFNIVHNIVQWHFSLYSLGSFHAPRIMQLHGIFYALCMAVFPAFYCISCYFDPSFHLYFQLLFQLIFHVTLRVSIEAIFLTVFVLFQALKKWVCQFQSVYQFRNISH